MPRRPLPLVIKVCCAFKGTRRVVPVMDKLRALQFSKKNSLTLPKQYCNFGSTMVFLTPYIPTHLNIFPTPFCKNGAIPLSTRGCRYIDVMNSRYSCLKRFRRRWWKMPECPILDSFYNQCRAKSMAKAIHLYRTSFKGFEEEFEKHMILQYCVGRGT